MWKTIIFNSRDEFFRFINENIVDFKILQYKELSDYYYIEIIYKYQDN